MGPADDPLVPECQVLASILEFQLVPLFSHVIVQATIAEYHRLGGL